MQRIASLLYYPNRAVNLTYACLGLHKLILSVRYRGMQPGDAIILLLLIDVIVLIGIPIVVCAWLLGFIGLSIIWFALVVLAMYLAPPFLTLATSELALQCRPK